MKQRKIQFRETLTLVAVGLLVLAALPLLAGVAVAARIGILAALMAAVAVGVALYATSPRFRDWLGFQVEPELTHSGLRFDTAVAVHPTHAWARIDGHEATVGADDFVPTVLGPVERVEVPPKGIHVKQGEVLFRVHGGEREVALRSPVTGTVVNTNPNLAEHPYRVNAAPFGDGWVARVEADDLRAEKRSLLRGDRARSWFREEVDGLLATLAGYDSVPTLPDGGVMVNEVHHHIDDATWDRIRVEMFGADREETTSA